jgi:hypothetical protein
MKTNHPSIAPLALPLFIALLATPASAFYNPTTGRWLSRDPVSQPSFTSLATEELLQGNVHSEDDNENLVSMPDELNLYRFVSNDAMAAYDAFGLWELRCRPLEGAGRITGQKHCWVECGGHSYSLLNDNGTAGLHVDDPRDRGRGTVQSSGPGKCDCIATLFNGAGGGFAYDKDQCNSNYYANQLLNCIGVSAARPSGAWGWDDCNDRSKEFYCNHCIGCQ